MKNFTNGSDSPFVALGDDGAMMAGISFNNSETQRFIGIAEGTAGTDYAERPVYFAGRGQNDPTSTDGSDIGEGEWWTEDGARPVFGGIEVTVEVEVVCLTVELEAPASGTATDCSYSGPDADRFLPSEERQTSQIIPPGFGDPTAAANSVFGSSFVVSLSEDGTVLRSGIVDGGTDFRWSGLRPGVGEFEGMSISENGWVRFDDPGSETSTARGVIQLTVLPADV